MFTVRKTNRNGFKERLQIKGFKTSDAMHKFLNKQTSNDWQETGDGSLISMLKPGTYAYASGRWHNVKTLDPSTLAHI